MQAKKIRHISIKEILSERRIDSLNELANLLAKQGIEASISTLSRDMKELGLSGWQELSFDLSEQPLLEISYKKMIKKIEVANQLVVIKTYGGFASSVAVELDKGYFETLLATIAGDDVILLIPKDKVSADKVKNEVMHYFYK